MSPSDLAWRKAERHAALAHIYVEAAEELAELGQLDAARSLHDRSASEHSLSEQFAAEASRQAAA